MFFVKACVFSSSPIVVHFAFTPASLEPYGSLILHTFLSTAYFPSDVKNAGASKKTSSSESLVLVSMQDVKKDYIEEEKQITLKILEIAGNLSNTSS